MYCTRKEPAMFKTTFAFAAFPAADLAVRPG